MPAAGSVGMTGCIKTIVRQRIRPLVCAAEKVLQLDKTEIHPAGQTVKRVLVIYYTQTGQLRRVLDSMLAPVEESSGVEVTWCALQPRPPFPFPWPVPKFLNVFPESVLMEPCALEPLKADLSKDFDLVVLAYTVWYLSPSIPMSAFLKSGNAGVLRGKPVVTVVNGRDKWLTAQERVKAELVRLGARLVDNVAFTHPGTHFQNEVVTLRWLWTGRKDAFGSFPAAGVSEGDIAAASRFGASLLEALGDGSYASGRPMLAGLGAVKVGADMVLQESVAGAIFAFSARLVHAAGRFGKLARGLTLLLFGACLLCLLVIAAPVVLIHRFFIAPLRRREMAERITYYEQPSGSSTTRMAGDQ